MHTNDADFSFFAAAAIALPQQVSAIYKRKLRAQQKYLITFLEKSIRLISSTPVFLENVYLLLTHKFQKTHYGKSKKSSKERC